MAGLVLYPSLSEMEDAIVLVLAQDVTLKAYIKDCRPFQGTLVEAMAEASYRDPAILVLFAGMDTDAHGSVEAECQVEWHIIVRSRNLRGNTARQAPAATGEHGTYEMVQDVIRVLARWDSDLDGMGTLEPGNVELLQARENRDRALSAYLLTFTCSAELRAEEPGEGQTLEMLQASYEVYNPTAGEFHAFATETIEVDG